MNETVTISETETETIPDIIIDTEFKHLMPILDKETFNLLEENILENGCRDSLVLWDGILIDGHNRYAICTKHDIPFNTVDKEFSAREEALIWIISNQLSRRNLTDMQMSHFRGVHYRAEKKLVGNRSKVKTNSGELYQNDTIQPGATRTRLANKYRVSQATITRDAKLSNAIDAIGEISPDAKEKILTKEVQLKKKELNDLASATNDELAEIAAKIDDGTYGKEDPSLVEIPENATIPGNLPAADPDAPHSPITAPPPGHIFSPELSAENQPLDLILSVMTGEAYYELLAASKSGDIVRAKETLRTYITTLEDLYFRF